MILTESLSTVTWNRPNVPTPGC